MRIVNDFNLRKQAEDLDIKIWQTPGFLFIIMGVVAVVIMAATYIVSAYYDNPQVLVISECLVVSVVLAVGTLVSRFVGQIASLNRMKSEFVAVASHQLRTPISAIRWEVELLLNKMKDGLNKSQIEKIENIAQLSHRMTRLINDLLDVARIDQGKLILKRQNFNLVKLAKEILDESIIAYEMRHIAVSFDTEEGLPDVFGDSEKVRLALDNLISNAFKYTTSGGKIRVGLFKKGENIVFEVDDNGVGIPEEQLARVFEKFFRSDNAIKYQTEGTGLGLYISKNIIEQLGGRIWFQSIENVGSKFSFSLPVTKG